MTREISRGEFLWGLGVFFGGLYLDPKATLDAFAYPGAQKFGNAYFYSPKPLETASVQKEESGAANFPVPDGWHFTETRGNASYPYGYSITGQYWQKFQELGGVSVIGYPVSHRFNLDGFEYQATQKMLLQKNPSLGGIVPANTIQFLFARGYGEVLHRQYGMPFPVQGEDGSFGDRDKARKIRLSWLTDPAIQAFYFRNSSDPVVVWGLPISLPENQGSFICQAFQRTTIIHWTKETLGGQPVGTVQFGNIGEITKQLGLIPKEAMEPRMVSPDWEGSIAWRTFSLINEERAKEHLNHVSSSFLLEQAAKIRVKQMSESGILSHDGWIAVLGNVIGQKPGIFYGEIVGRTNASSVADTLVTAFMNSPSHRACVLGRQYRTVGINSGCSSKDNLFYLAAIFSSDTA